MSVIRIVHMLVLSVMGVIEYIFDSEMQLSTFLITVTQTEDIISGVMN